MKVCILQNSMTMGGTDTFVINLSKGLVKDGYEVTVVLSVDSNQELPREKELIATGVSILKTNSFGGGVRSGFRHFKMLYDILKKGNFDVFHTNIDLFNGPQLVVAWLAGVPVRVCHSHNGMQGKEVLHGKTIKISVYQFLMRKLCWSFSNRRCGCSEVAMNFLYQDKWKTDKHSTVVYNGIEVGKYKNFVDVENKKKELPLTSKFSLLTVGRIDTQKNPLFIVDVFQEVCRRREDCDLIWVGTGEMEKDILEKTTTRGINLRVHLLGQRNDVDAIMKCCDVFIFPSIFEGLPVVLIEAQASNMPCIVSDTVTREVDVGGCFYLPINQGPEEWADLVDTILDKKIACEINHEKLKIFTSDYMVQEMEKVFERE